MSDWVVHHGDCLDVLRTLPDASVDAVVTDPPYGIDIVGTGQIGGSGSKSTTKNYGASEWDRYGLNAQQWAEIQRVSRQQIVFGFEHLAAVLGPPGSVVVWDKKCQNDWWDTFADCEIAWVSDDGPARVFRHLWMGACRESETGKGQGKVHPCQKPVAVMDWLISNYIPEGGTVLDPFCGSGTTGVACVQTGRKFIGIEIDKGYCDIARRRIAEAVPLCAGATT